MNKLLIVLVLLIATLAGDSFAKMQTRGFDRQIFVVGEGQVRLVYVRTGDPISRPYLLKLLVKCTGQKDWKPIGEYQMCGLENYEYDAKAKTLMVKYFFGRVVQSTGESFCDTPPEQATLSLKGLCSTPERKTDGKSELSPQSGGSSSSAASR